MNQTDGTSAQGEIIDPKVAADRQMLRDARAAGKVPLLGAFIKLSGPGWLQSAITLGGGSLGGSLFLAAIVGYDAMWIQPLAMIMGIIMLSAIGYVTLSTGERPFDAINQHVNPVLGWGWIIATMMANMVWCMPQFSLAGAALQENLGVPDTDSWLWAVTLVLAVVAVGIVWFYNTGSMGIKIFEIIVKLMVALIVVSFFGVVVTMTIAGDLPWGRIFSGYIPDLSLLTSPAKSLQATIEPTGAAASFWTEYVVTGQRNRMIAVAATAVGINMTFLLPYSMLARGWDKDFRGMAIFDLATGLFIPFIIVTSCVVIAAAAQLHNQPAPGLLGETDEHGDVVPADSRAEARFIRLLNARATWELKQHDPDRLDSLQEQQKAFDARLDEMRRTMSPQAFDEAVAADPTLQQGPLDAVVAEMREQLPDADRYVAAVVVDRDAWDLARALEPLTGSIVAQYVFGIGVLGVALSSIVILMLINGFVFAEIFGKPGNVMLNRLGALVVVAIGVVGSLTLWREEARYFLVIPTSVFGMMLAPIAYLAFFMLMNNRNLMGQYMPRGPKRIWWNTLMIAALAFAVAAAGMAIWNQSDNFPGTNIPSRNLAIALIAALVILGVIIHVVRKGKASSQQ